MNPLLKCFGNRKEGSKVLIGIEKMERESSPHLGHGLFRGLPYIDGRVCVALPAKDHRIAVAASVAPDVENPAFGDFDHDRLPQISLVIQSRIRGWS